MRKHRRLATPENHGLQIQDPGGPSHEITIQYLPKGSVQSSPAKEAPADRYRFDLLNVLASTLSSTTWPGPAQSPNDNKKPNDPNTALEPEPPKTVSADAQVFNYTRARSLPHVQRLLALKRASATSSAPAYSTQPPDPATCTSLAYPSAKAPT